MKAERILFLILLIPILTGAQAIDATIYGINRVNGYYLAKIDENTGTVKNISSSSLPEGIVNGASTIDPINNLYIYTTMGQIQLVDLLIGNISNSYSISDFSSFHFNSFDSCIYGIHDNNGFYLAKFNIKTGTLVDISASKIPRFITNFSSTINPVNNTYLYKSLEQIYIVDIKSGNLINSYTVPDLNCFHYNCKDSIIYGLNRVNGCYLAKFDDKTGNMVNISTAPLPQIIFNLSTAINPFNNTYLYASVGQIYVIDLKSGSVINSYSESDFFFFHSIMACVNQSSPITLKINIPNVFTPNGDNKNDYFYIYHSEAINKIEFFIYNRWGKVVFKSKKADFKWDGTINGNECSEGTYFWVANLTFHNNITETRNGTVTLLR